MQIGELARRTGVSERLLRYYECQGLLQPRRLPNGYREYREADVRLVRHTRSLLAAGLSTAVIAELLPCIRDDDERVIPTCPVMITRLREERARITASITQLRTSRKLLDAVLAAAPAGGA